jgi:tetratricopeptide (TPR) repeat protein
MAATNDFATGGSAREFTCSGAAAGHRGQRPLLGGAALGVTLLGWLLAFLVGAGSLSASEKGMVTGTVAGPSKVPIPGAKVMLAAADGSRQAVTTDQRGHYSFPSVDPATYSLFAEAAGYQPLTRPNVQVTGGSSITVDLLLEATGPPQPNHTLPVPQQPSYYDDTQLKASGVKSTTDAAGYSSQAQSPKRLLSEGPSLTGNPPPPRQPASPQAAEVERELRAALQADPNSFDSNHQLGEYYLSSGDPGSGIPYLEKAQELKPGDSPNGCDLAAAYLDTKSPAKAQPLLRDLIRRKDTAEYRHLLGEADEALGDAASAANEFQLAAQMDPSEKNLFDWGNELLFHESLEPAIEVFRRGVALYPDSLRMYIGLGLALYSHNSYDAAIEALCHASDLNPSDPRPYLFLGKMYNVSLAQADEVAMRMKRFMETNPNNALAYYYGALTLWKGSRGGDRGVDLARVEALFRKSLALDPRWADAHLQLGILYSEQHREPEAMAEFQAAIRLNPDDPDAHYRLAQAYLRTGDQEHGQQELRLYDKLRQPPADETEKRRREIQRLVTPPSEPGKTKP